MDEAITTIEIRQNSVNHRVLHSPLIVHKEKHKMIGDSLVTPCLLAALRHLVQL